MIAKLLGHSSNSTLPVCYLGERISIKFATSTFAGPRVELERQFWKVERDNWLDRRDVHTHFNAVEKWEGHAFFSMRY